jgi:uncharacterized membrane protein
MKYLSVIGTLAFVTFGQLILKYEVNKLGISPGSELRSLLSFFARLLTNVGVVSGLTAAAVAALCWLYALSRFELSAIYPLLSLNFVLVPLLSAYLFREHLNAYNIAGILLIVAGIVVFSKGV